MELLRTRCNQGQLIITDEQIIVEYHGLGNRPSRSLQRSSFTSLDSKPIMPAIMGMGGGTNLVFHGQGAEILQADMVPPKVAKEVVFMLTGRR